MIRRAASRAALPPDDPDDGLVPLRYGRIAGDVRADRPGMAASRRRASGNGRFAHTARASAVTAADSSVRPGLASNPAFPRSLQRGGTAGPGDRELAAHHRYSVAGGDAVRRTTEPLFE